MKRIYTSMTAALALALALGAPPAFAQHDHADLLIGSDADGGGGLVLDFPFAETPVVRVTDSGFAGLFSSTDPGFMPAGDEPDEGVFELDLGSEIGIELTDIDLGVSIQLGPTTLDAVGESAVIGTHDNADPELSDLHQHPELRVTLTEPDNLTFAEGRFSFRVFDTGASYGDSAIASLTLSNGYLGEAVGNAACVKAISGEQRKWVAATYKGLGKCLDLVLAAESGGNPAAALAACSLDEADPKSLVSKLAATRTKALDKIAKKCGALSDSSTPFTLSQVSTHLGMGDCRAAELAGATYVSAREEIAGLFDAELGAGACDVGGTNTCTGGPNAGAACTGDEECSWEEAVGEAFSCLKNSAGEEAP
jgi:hypothetical protein